MRRPFTKFLSMLLALITLMSMFVLPANAASTTSSVNCSGTSNGGVSKYVYVKTGNATWYNYNPRRITLTMTAGKLQERGSFLNESAPVYGAYELKISYWNGSKWVQEQNYDIYNKASATVTLNKANTYYRIQIYSWNVKTVFNSYWNNNVGCTDGKEFKKHFSYSPSSGVYTGYTWATIPKCTAKPNSGCTMYSSNPL